MARTEATGFGLIYFVSEYLASKNDSFDGKTVIISGSGNVATYAAVKAIQMGAKVVSMSDSDSCIYDKDGIDIELVKEIKQVRRGRICEYTDVKKIRSYKR